MRKNAEARVKTIEGAEVGSNGSAAAGGFSVQARGTTEAN
jgi:hypothetical protein